MSSDASLKAEESISPPRGRPGLKPGQRHSGQFKPGHDPRRHLDGPRVVKKDFQAAIREHTDKAIDVLVECMENANAPYKERQAAAELVLAHAHGSPVNRVVHAQIDNTGSGNASQLSLADLRKRAAVLLDDDLETTYAELPHVE